MIYLQSQAGLKIIVLETQNLEEIQKGRPASSPDKTVLIAWTPDPVWLADRIMETGGDAIKIAALIDEGARRPQKPPRPHHKPHSHKFNQ